MKWERKYKILGKTMRKFIIITFCIVPCILHNTKLFSPNTINFFMRSYPDLEIQAAAHAAEQKIKNPEKLAKYSMTSSFYNPIIEGIFSSYAGYLVASGNNGQITFPLRHNKPVMYYLVTPQIFPVIMFGNTIHHWELVPHIPAKLYKVEKKLDEELMEHYWEVSQVPLPENKIISKKAIIIFANPEKIYIPEGITPTRDDPQLVLPDVYVKKSLAKVREALYILTIRHFFSKPTTDYKHEPLRHIKQIAEL
jgi:hypothetical protein